ncbi:hypothetical protein [Phenylobacterium sp. J367]|uniref:hypothetical protein n=1 Tax=Phenylobacterium sp. J367 TaxID=2898435 RepID=UPI0021514BA1|nr:hypothetical protein [Phenylobacterium sp. J367]MCR5876946.1 hypothetical protein [Phenylobacterium sp. J367]
MKERPLLVGYLFTRVEPRELWRVEDVFGVYKVLDHAREDGRRIPTPIPDAFVDKLRTAEDAGKFDRTLSRTRAKGAERSTWQKLEDFKAMSEEEKLRALGAFLGVKVEPEPDEEPDYSGAMDEKRAA